MKNIYKSTARLILGFVARLLLVVPISLVPFYPEVVLIQQLAVFTAILLAAHAVLLTVVSTLVPPAYAIKTEISVLEFNLWIPQTVSIYSSAIILTAIAFTLASYAIYWYASVVILSAISHFIWPGYVGRIDLAAKNELVRTITNA